MRTFSGTPISPGYIIGPLQVHRPEAESEHETHTIPASGVAAEKRRLRAAVNATRADLESLQTRLADNLVDPSAAHIFHAHLHILGDPMVLEKIEQVIRDRRLAACCALRLATDEVAGRFEAMENPYLAQRSIDLRDVSHRVMGHLRPELMRPLAKLTRPSIIVAKSMLPSDLIHLDRERTLAIVTEEGGVADHAAIVTRSLGIPGITGVKGITSKVETGQEAVVDGHLGKCFVAVGAKQRKRYQALAEKSADDLRSLRLLRDQPAVTLDGERITLCSNVSNRTDVAMSLDAGAEAVGLFRTEMAFLASIKHPSESEQLRAYRAMLRGAEEMPISVRTLDLGGDKVLGSDGSPAQQGQSMMSLRGIRRSLAEPKQFQRQLRAILRLAVDHDLRVLLPMVVSVSDVVRAREEIAIASEALQRQGREHRADLPLGIMLETPASVMLIEDLLPHCDFVNVGTNDLIQYMLVADRTDGRFREHYTLFHPAVLRAMATIARASQAVRKPTCLCGEIAGMSDVTALLIGLGFTTLSMSPSELPRVKRKVRGVRLKECGELAEQIQRFSFRQKIEDTLRTRH